MNGRQADQFSRAVFEVIEQLTTRALPQSFHDNEHLDAAEGIVICLIELSPETGE